MSKKEGAAKKRVCIVSYSTIDRLHEFNSLPVNFYLFLDYRLTTTLGLTLDQARAHSHTGQKSKKNLKFNGTPFFSSFPSDDIFSKSDVYLPVYVCVCKFQARSPGAKG